MTRLLFAALRDGVLLIAGVGLLAGWSLLI